MSTLQSVGQSRQGIDSETETDDCLNRTGLSDHSLEAKLANIVMKSRQGPHSRENSITMKTGPLFASIEKMYEEQGRPSFFKDGWLYMEALPSLIEPGTEYLASHAVLPTRSVSAKEVLTGNPGSDSAILMQVFALAPTWRRAGDLKDTMIRPGGRETSTLCVRITAEEGEQWPEGLTGLSGWAKHWKSKTVPDTNAENEKRKDILGGGTLSLLPVEDSYLNEARVHRFEQKRDGLRPKPFSAWFGRDKDHAQQNAQNQAEYPHLKVGFSARLYTLYTPATKPETAATAKGDAEAVSHTDIAGSASNRSDN